MDRRDFLRQGAAAALAATAAGPFVHAADKSGAKAPVVDDPVGKSFNPHDAGPDRDGDILVAEWVATGRISFLRRVG